MAMTKEQQGLFKQLRTKLQRETCLGILKGMSQRQAYYAAGGKAKNDNSADACVSELLANPKVKAFMDAMYAEQVNSTIMTRDEALGILGNMARAPLISPMARTAALRQMGKMQGWEAAQKFDINGHIITTEEKLTPAQREMLDKVLDNEV